MISIDTNVLVRSLIDDDETQDQVAREFFRKACATEGLFISAFIVLETAWVLKTKKVSRLVIADLLEALLNTPNIVVSHETLILSAIQLYRNGKADFCDYILLSESLIHKASALKTFDQTFLKEAQKVMKTV